MATKQNATPSDVRIVCQNRRARHDYSIEETFEAGMVLQGSEVKSLREGHVHLTDAYAIIENGEAFLVGCHINPYGYATAFKHDPDRRRKLLLKAREISRIAVRVRERGQTLVPLKIYFKKHLAKIEIALAKGKAQYDRREDIKRRDVEREVDRARRENYR